MRLKLDEIQSYIDSKIFKRGQAYFKQGAVVDIELRNFTWHAEVEGSDLYEVSLEVVEGEIQNWACTCPYDWGIMCKHMVAVALTVQEMEGVALEEVELKDVAEAPAPPKPKPPKSRKSPKKKSDLQSVLASMSEAELRKELLKLAQQFPEIKSQLLLRYSHYADAQGITFYKDLISSLIKNAKGHYRFIEYRDASSLGKRISQLRQNHQGDLHTSIHLCQLIISQMAKAIQHADDSDGYMGGAISEAFEQLQHITKDGNPDYLKEFFKLAIKEHGKKHYQGWDWASDWRMLAFQSTQTAQEAKKLLGQLDKVIAEQALIDQESPFSRHYSYDHEFATVLKWQLLVQWETAESEAFMEANLRFSKMREIAIKDAMAAGNYERAFRLAEAGLAQDKANRLPGLVSQWQKYLVQIAQQTKDKSFLIKIREEQFLSFGDIEVYRELKKLLPKADFLQEKESWIKALREKSTYRGGFFYFPEEVARIYIEDKQYDRLMGLLEEFPDLALLDRYHELLAKQYPEFFVSMYNGLVRDFMDQQAKDRKAYKLACQYLDKIVKLGGVDEALTTVELWQQQYARRKSLMDELGKLAWL